MNTYQPTIARRLRTWALGRHGHNTFDCLPTNYEFNVVRSFMHNAQQSSSLTPDERRMFLLFIAEELES